MSLDLAFFSPPISVKLLMVFIIIASILNSISLPILILKDYLDFPYPYCQGPCSEQVRFDMMILA
jgi:hypothetical protein